MLIPSHWAEGRVQAKTQAGRTLTVRRFGWSNESAEAAQAHADQRAQEAWTRIASGQALEKRERKAAYGGAPGVPIREEILAAHGEAVITRNSYGAHCLNTPNVLFADIDYYSGPPLRWIAILAAVLMACAALAWLLLVGRWNPGRMILCMVFAGYVAVLLTRFVWRMKGGPAGVAQVQLRAFLARHPAWHLRVYETPAGLRVLAMHRTFRPDEPAVREFFQALSCDPDYVRLCLDQDCFRARLTAKPWRIGVETIRPRPGIWPVNPERSADRARWVETYERKAQEYAACRYRESLGSQEVHPAALAMQKLHDELCRATGAMPLA